ncbi:uncharacterized protein Dana_GF24078, isoform C [Drosophila ananassae]|uniref:Uncharacterized protein, isoform B n=1 Tax=Drosophila ananassae TaxID=7217 RepID=B3MAD6_DROAN|nr:uncharacterized protein LOC6506713 [Drosophila ananassae]XP_032309771.1 uncharacterized protein LOC6506713 [Drosophila ananassae]EDV40187.2 uncharacterized protein Dana_GF24078, isoform B [Drosophila ananassae]KPU78433.1 uncharacterized protein Dana_GF24078, isoform C [Drosophila ananassae]
MASALPDRFSAGKRQFWREFLALYQGMPELWDAHHVNYRNKELRNRAYELLETKLREIQPNATRTEVGRRINIFRTNYRREQMRILKQKELGLHSDLCKPTLWFYDYMGFLLTQETFQHRSRKGRMSNGDKQKQVFRLNRGVIPDPSDGLGDWHMNDKNESYLPDLESQKSEETSLLSPKIEIIEPDGGNTTNEIEHSDLKEEADDMEISASKDTDCSTHGEAKTRCENSRRPDHSSLSEASQVLARSWAIQYEEMAPTQRILARKAIADILFEGCMGNLRINRGDQRNTVGNHLYS